MLLDLCSLDGSEHLALGLEDQEICLLLDVEDVILQEEVIASLLTHVIDEGESKVEVVILVNGFQEAGEGVGGARLEVLDGDWKSYFFKGVLVNLVLGFWLTSGKKEGGDHVSRQGFLSELDHVQEKVSIELMISEDCGEKTIVSQILSSETVNKEPVEHPAHCLGELLRSSTNKGIPLSKSLFDELLHLLERCVLNNISSLSIEDLASEKSPKHLKHKLRVLLTLINKDLL